MILPVALAMSLTAPPDRWFGSDKLKHLLVAAFTQSVSHSALQVARVRHDRAVAGAWLITATVSVAKEVHDRRAYGLFSVRDLVWDAAGAGLATIVIDRAVRTGSGADDTSGTSPRPASDFPVLSRVGPGPILARRATPPIAPGR